MPRVGSIQLDPVPDATGVIGSYGECFPGMAAEEWAPYRQLYPDLVAGEDWRAPSQLSRPLGTSDDPRRHRRRTARKLARLDTRGRRQPARRAGRARGRGDRRRRRVPHPSAHRPPRLQHGCGRRAALPPGALRGASRRPRLAKQHADRPHIRRCVEPLADRFETVSGEVELGDGVIAFEAPGHYPGHMAVRLTSDGERAVLLADVAVHPALLDRLDVAYVFDVDPASAVETRRALLPELVDCDVLVACGHYPGPGIGRLITQEGGVTFVRA